MVNNELTSPIFFVCGTPSDRYGFEYITLDGRQLPEQATKHLDTNRTEKNPQGKGATHFFYHDGREGWAIYAEYRSIHPKDTDYNRGAFIAVGCWSSTALAPDQAIEALLRIENIHRELKKKRHPDRDSFLPEFQLSAYVAPTHVTMLGSEKVVRLRLAILFCQAIAGHGTYGDPFRNLILTSNETLQGSLARLCPPAPKIPDPPDTRNWGARLYKVAQDAPRTGPQIRRELQRLPKDKFAKITKLLERIANEVKTPSGTGSEWYHLTTEGIILFIFGTTIGVAATLAMVLIIQLFQST